MNKEHYKIKTAYANYYVEIWHQYETIDKVYIGARKKCIGFSIYLNEKGKVIKNEPPEIDGFGFNQHCNITGNHIKGTGSVHLMNTALRFIINHYKLPENTKFQFKDTSFIECIKYHMPLRIYYTIFHGKTWYEDKFGATPLDKHAIPRLQEGKQKLKEFLSLKPNIEDFFHEDQEDLKVYVLNIYTKCESLKECLDILKKEDCKVFKGWVVSIFSHVMSYDFNQEWYITNKVEQDFLSYTKLKVKPDKLFNVKGGMYFRRDEL